MCEMVRKRVRGVGVGGGRLGVGMMEAEGDT